MSKSGITIDKMSKSEKTAILQGIENKKWVKNNYNNLKNKYNNYFIAVKDKKIIDSGQKLDNLLKRINSQYPDDNEIVIEFISKKDICYFL
ncbi:MAG: DUF5678 domain-containing protein [Candidatus Helarchaeota archaeon]